MIFLRLGYCEFSSSYVYLLTPITKSSPYQQILFSLSYEENGIEMQRHKVASENYPTSKDEAMVQIMDIMTRYFRV